MSQPTTVKGSQATNTGTVATSQPSAPQAPQSVWEVGDVGFDTEKKLWFVQLYNDINQNVGTYMAKNVTLKRGKACQYEWKDGQGRAFWHVRERFFADEIENIGLDPAGANLTIKFKETDSDAGAIRREEVPREFHHLHYAFHLTNKEIAIGNIAPLGFVEFYDSDGKLIQLINNRWLLIEDIDRRSVGSYPNIRLRIDRKDIERIVATRTALIIQGTPHAPQQE